MSRFVCRQISILIYEEGRCYQLLNILSQQVTIPLTLLIIILELELNLDTDFSFEDFAAMNFAYSAALLKTSLGY